jgi:hypothetical protein
MIFDFKGVGEVPNEIDTAATGQILQPFPITGTRESACAKGLAHGCISTENSARAARFDPARAPADGGRRNRAPTARPVVRPGQRRQVKFLIPYSALLHGYGDIEV